MSNSRTPFTFTLLLLLATTSAHAEKPRVYTANPLEAGTAYNQRARDAYAAGVWTLEEIESSTVGDEKSEIDQQRAYERALLAFKEAVTAEPSMYEAHTYLGYVNRKLTRYDDSLQAYDAALKVKPDYVFAIEYQGEAHLGLGDFNRARFNYLRLYALDQQLAAKLLDAISDWLRQPHNRNAPELATARAWSAAQRDGSH